MSIAPPPGIGGEEQQKPQRGIAAPPQSAAATPRISPPPPMRAAATPRIAAPPQAAKPVHPQWRGADGNVRLSDPLAVQAAGKIGGPSAAQHASSALEKVGEVFETFPALLGAAGQDIADPKAGLLGAPHVKDYFSKLTHGQMRQAVEQYKHFGEANLRAMAAQGDPVAKWIVGNAPAGQVAHPIVAGIGDTVENILNPLNLVPDGLGAAGRTARASRLGQSVEQAAHNAAEAVRQSKMMQHPRMQRVVHKAGDIAQEMFGSGARHIDQAVAPGQEAAAHAARRADLQATTGGRAVGDKFTQNIFGTQANDADVIPALQAHQRKTKEAFIHLQRQFAPSTYARAESFLNAYRAARTANEPGLAAGNWEKAMGAPSVHDLEYPDVHHFVQRELGDLAPDEQQSVLKVAKELELSQEGPRMEELTPEQQRISNALRGHIGYTTAVTPQDILGSGERQIGFAPKRDIYAFDTNPKGGTQGIGVRERIDPATIPTVLRAQKLYDYSQTLPEEDRLLHAAPFSAKSPQQALEDHFSTRFANIKARQAQREFQNVRSSNGNPLIYEPPLAPMYDPSTGSFVVPKDKETLEHLVSAAQENAALNKMGDVVGMKPQEIDTYLHDRGPQAGVAAGRAREAKSAANKANRIAGNGALERTDKGLSDLGPTIAREQQGEEQGVRAALEGRELPAPGQAYEPTREERLQSGIQKQLDDLRSRSVTRAKALIDRYVPVRTAAGKLEEAITGRPGSREQMNESRGVLSDFQKQLDEIGERYRNATNIDPKERATAVKQIAESLHAAAKAAVEPYYAALSELGGRIIPDQMWDEAKGRFVDQTRFEGLAPNLRGSAKTLREDQNADRRYGNLDELTDLLRERLGQPDLTDDDVLEFFKSARKPQVRDFMDEAKAQFADMTGTEARRLQNDLLETQRYARQAKSVHKQGLKAAQAIAPEEKAITGAGRNLLQRESAYGRALSKQLAQGVSSQGKAVEKIRGNVDKLQAERRKIAGRVYDVMDNSHLQQSKTLQRGLAQAHARLETFGKQLDTYAAKASHNAKIREIARQYARLTQAQKAALQALYKRVLKDTPRRKFYPQPTYDTDLYVPAEDATVHGQKYPVLDGQGKVIHRAVLKQLEYDHPKYQDADAAAHFVAATEQLARTSMVTNPAIHPIFNQGLMYALETGDWLGLLDHSKVLGTALDPVRALKEVPGDDLDAKIANGMRGLSQKANSAAWKAIADQRAEFADELAHIKQYHGFTETAPLEMDSRDFTQPQYDDNGKLTGWERTHDTEMDPARIKTTRPADLPLGGKVSKMYRAFARWNHRIVWETSEPLLMARWVRYYMKRKGMDPAQAVDAAREQLGSDKLTQMWQRAPILFPRWTRTVLYASIRLGLTKPGTWNAPLQGTRTEREGVGAGDIPTGLNPMTLAFKDGLDPNGNAQYKMLGLHDPMATPLNTLAAAAVGDPRQSGILSHVYDPAEFVINRLNPADRMGVGAALGGTLGTLLSKRWEPGTVINPRDLKLSPMQILLSGLMGEGSRVVAPLQNAADVQENPLSIPAGLTGSTIYDRSDNFRWPDASP